MGSSTCGLIKTRPATDVAFVYLHASKRDKSLEPRTKATVRELIGLHPVMRSSSPLSCDTFDGTHVSQIDLIPLISVSMLCHPSTCSAMSRKLVQPSSVRSVIIIVRRGGPKSARKNSSVLHAERHRKTIFKRETINVKWFLLVICHAKKVQLETHYIIGYYWLSWFITWVTQHMAKNTKQSCHFEISWALKFKITRIFWLVYFSGSLRLEFSGLSFPTA